MHADRSGGGGNEVDLRYPKGVLPSLGTLIHHNAGSLWEHEYVFVCVCAQPLYVCALACACVWLCVEVQKSISLNTKALLL